jgi:hypothetical protein
MLFNESIDFGANFKRKVSGTPNQQSSRTSIIRQGTFGSLQNNDVMFDVIPETVARSKKVKTVRNKREMKGGERMDTQYDDVINSL